MKNKFIWVIVLSVVLLGSLAIWISPAGDMVGSFAQDTLSSSGNVWCDNFEWYCCQQSANKLAPTTIDANIYTTCSVTSTDSCLLSNVQFASSGSGRIFVGSQNCRLVYKLLYGNVEVCDNQVPYILSSGSADILVPRGSLIYSDYGSRASITLTTYSSRLALTGASAEAVAGIPVSGSSSCTWNTALKNPVSGAGIGSPYIGTSTPLSLSYTVPPNDCVLSKAGTQSLCGNIFDECSGDSDCDGYPINGNQVCTGSTLMTYKCLNKGGLPSGVTQISDNKYVGQPTVGGTDSIKYSGTGKVCTVDQTLNKQVSCCPSSDVCGSNAFCDSKTFTCKATTVCTVTSDCNQAPSCDGVNLKYKTPACTGGQCTFKSANVECCIPENCASTQDCDLTTHTCKDKVVPKTPCTFECCLDDSLYIDRPCASGFCVNHICSINPQCNKDSDCDVGLTCKDGVCKLINNETCQSSLGGLIARNIGTKDSCNFWCSVGLKSPEKVSVCVTDYTPLTLVGIFVLGLIAILVFGLRKKGESVSSKKSSSNFSKVVKSKIFWKIVAGVVAVVLLILYFKILIWVAIGLLIVLILDAIFLHRKIWKTVKKIFRW